MVQLREQLLRQKFVTGTPSNVTGGASVYANLAALPTSGNTQGDFAHVTANNGLYFWNGSGWYSIAIVNATPTISGVSGSYALATDGTATTVTVTASDPEDYQLLIVLPRIHQEILQLWPKERVQAQMYGRLHLQQIVLMKVTLLSPSVQVTE